MSKQSLFRNKLNHLLEYFGISRTSYSSSTATVIYDENDPQAYYLNQSIGDESSLRFHPDEIPLYYYKGKWEYLPVFVCLYSLGHFELYRRGGLEEDLSKFRKTAEWFVRCQQDNGAWLINVDMKKFYCFKPWTSALTQGMVISLLLRAFSIFGDQRYLDSARKGLLPFRIDVANGGVASYEKGRVFFDEYPSLKGYHVLNGFIFSLWGLLDLVRIIDDPDASELYHQGLTTLIEWLPRFDLGYWSLYCISRDRLRNPASVPYHRLHIDQMNIMHQITGDDIFKRFFDSWSADINSSFNALRSLPEKVLWNIIRGL